MTLKTLAPGPDNSTFFQLPFKLTCANASDSHPRQLRSTMYTKLLYPILYVTNMSDSIRFYDHILGFSIVENSTDFSVLRLADTQIALNSQDSKHKHPGHQTVIIGSTDVERAYASLPKEVTVFQEKTDTAYGLTFIIRDPDGNLVEVVEDLD